jgi:tetratricopeptide (TPR) repeat protein
VLGQKISIGRGEKNDVVLTDLKAARVHAYLTFTAKGWALEDAGSPKGILYNGELKRGIRLKFHDLFTIGDTVMEFTPAGAVTAASAAASAAVIAQVNQEAIKSAALLAQYKRNEMLAKQRGNAPKELVGSKWSDFLGSGAGSGGKGNKPLLYGVVAVGLFLVLYGGDIFLPKTVRKVDVALPVENISLATLLPTVTYNQTAENIFKDGLREYFSGNYNRARTQFETVLQIMPGHPLAGLYLENCNTSVKEEVKMNMELAKKAFQAGKLRESRAHFDRVLRFLYKDQTNPSYTEAREQYDKVTKAMNNGASITQ